MSSETHEPPKHAVTGEPASWLERPGHADMVLKVFYGLCGLLLVLGLFLPQHGKFQIELWPGFYALFGFIACVALVLIAKELRKLLMRPEDHYDA